MNAVIYARYSSTAQRDVSMDIQLEDCRNYCEQQGLTVVKEYVDRALTGTDDNRPNFQRMIEDSSTGLYERIVVYRFNSFFRQREKSVLYKGMLKRKGIRVLSVHEYIADDPSGVIVESFFEAMDEFYSLELSQKIKKGMDKNGEQCLCTGGNIALGFKVNQFRQFEVDPNTAPIVETVFEMYANGKTVTEITRHLNSLGYKTSRGVPFNENSLHTMLKNSGRCKEMMTGSSATGKQGKIYNYYICNGRKAKRCEKDMVKKDYIENLVLAQCRKLLSAPNIEKISKEVSAICQAERDTSNLRYLEKRLAESERRRENALNAVLETDMPRLRENIYEKIAQLEAEQENIREEISKETMPFPSLTAPKIKFFLMALKKGSMTDEKYKKMLIKIFVNKIYLYDDRITITFHSGDDKVEINDRLLSELEEKGR